VKHIWQIVAVEEVAQWPLLPAGAGFPTRRGSSTLAICCSESLQQSIESKKNIFKLASEDTGLNLLSKAINGCNLINLSEAISKKLYLQCFNTYTHNLNVYFKPE
jgi:hypothetical protein